MVGHNLTKSFFAITKLQELKLNKLINEISTYNKHTNLVGKSTLVDPWRSHVLDSIQLKNFIKKKNSSILDMGTGAGFPGLVLSIVGYREVHLIDSNGKKINFIKSVCKKLDINAQITLGRIERLKKQKFDFIISRALASLNKLLTYSHNFLKEDTVMIFLKGKAVNEEITEAKKEWIFNNRIHQSYSDKRGKILVIDNLILRNL